MNDELKALIEQVREQATRATVVADRLASVVAKLTVRVEELEKQQSAQIAELQANQVMLEKHHAEFMALLNGVKAAQEEFSRLTGIRN